MASPRIVFAFAGLALAGCSLITDPGSYEGGESADASMSDASRDDAGSDAGVDAALDPCGGTCDAPTPVCVQVAVGRYECQCGMNAHCSDETPICFEGRCVGCDDDSDGFVADDPACDAAAGRPEPTPLLRDCDDHDANTRPGLPACGTSDFAACSNAGAELNIRGYTAHASVSHVVGNGSPPPPPTDWALPLGVRPPRAPFDVAFRPNGEPVVAYLSGRTPRSLEYGASHVTAVSLDDPKSATATDLLVDRTGGFKDIQLITSGGELFLGWAKATEAQLWQYDSTTGRFNGVGSLTALPPIRGPLALTRFGSGQARLYVRTGNDSQVTFHWTISGGSASRTFTATMDSNIDAPASDGLDMAAAGDYVWLTQPDGLVRFSMTTCDTGSVCLLPVLDAFSPRALLDEGSIVLAAGLGTMVSFPAIHISTDCDATDICNFDSDVPDSNGFAVYDIATALSASDRVVLVAHDRPMDDGEATGPKVVELRTHTSTRGVRLFEDLPNGGRFANVFGVAIDTLQIAGMLEVVVAALAQEVGGPAASPPKIYVTKLRFCGSF